MRIIHRISFNIGRVEQEQLSALGIDVQVGLATFEIEESDPSWPQVKAMSDACHAVDLVRTEFTDAEVRQAAFVELVPTWHWGYPQPESGFGYLNATYDLTAYCSLCGVGKRQVAPFKTSSEPKWGKSQVLQLNWVFDEFFVRPEVWKGTFEPRGIPCRPVIHHRTGNELETIVQLVIEPVAQSTLGIPEEHSKEICERCHRTKYQPISRGFFPGFVSDPGAAALCRTKEVFGTGASAWNAVIASGELGRQMRLKGIKLVPLK